MFVIYDIERVCSLMRGSLDMMMQSVSIPVLARRITDNSWLEFVLILLSLTPATGDLALIARLMRVLRLISTIPKLRLIVETLMHSIPSMGHVMPNSPA